MNKINVVTVIFLLATNMLSLHVNAAIYTWTDEDGKTHFSDKPIDDDKVTTIKPKENNNISKAGNTNSQWQQDYNQNKQAKVEQAKKDKKIAQKKQGYCDELKSELAIYTRGGRIAIMSPDGKRDFQSDAQIKEKRKELSKTIKKHCR